MKRALIIGSKGQDGVYLSRNLIKKDYDIIGIDKNFIDSTLVIPFTDVNILDKVQITNLLNEYKPDEIYHLAAFHHSSENFDVDESVLLKNSIEIHISSLFYILDWMKKKPKYTKLFYAGSSHVFGDCDTNEQDENTPFKPNCIYGITKVAGINLCQYYREKYSVFASAGILYNHESPLRKSIFVSKKIVETAIAIKKQYKSKLIVGDLNAQIDWGYAPDYVEAMYQMLQLEKSEDFVIASGRVRTVRDFIIGVFEYLDLNWLDYVYEDPNIIKKKNKRNLKGSYIKLHLKTGWQPSTNFKDFIKIMVDEVYEN